MVTIKFIVVPERAVDFTVLSLIFSEEEKDIELEGSLVVERVAFWLDILTDKLHDKHMDTSDASRLLTHLERTCKNIEKGLPLWERNERLKECA